MTDPVVDQERGLDAAQVAERVAAGQVNDVPSAPSRTLREILRANLFTRFNALMTALVVVPLALGEPGDALFFGVVIANIVIGTGQEVRAKRTLDRLSLLSAPRARVVREGTVREVGVRELVLDDVLDLKPGDQVVADATVLLTDGLELDESLLTGESDPVVKETGEEVLSGSFVAAGRGRVRVAKVGADAYAARLAEEARRFTLVHSELMATVNRIITIVTWILVPTAILQLVSSLWLGDEDVRESIIGAVAGVVGMVPEGLVLLTSVAFAVGVVRLARRRTLVQELPAIEVLARVDTVCVDKTGTITEGALDLADVDLLDGPPDGTAGGSAGGSADGSAGGSPDGPADDPPTALAAIAAAEPDPNPTLQAIVSAHGTSPGWTLTDRVAFSSARKWSGYAFDGRGAWVLGAPEFVLLDEFDAIRPAVEEQAAAGRRVLVLAHSPAAGFDGESLPDGLRPVALALFEDRIRPEAPETLRYFAAQGVRLKVISGDNPVTVGAVARRAGLDGDAAPFDARELPTDAEELADVLDAHDVYGRVTPHQKQAMVKALQARSHVVAMTGDGVNDVLALKDSDCGIAMASGSEATRAVAQLVLLDSDFSALPPVVAEGRRVINNIERVASLFLTKTAYASILAILTGVLTLPYPFRPRHLTLISSLTIGIPAFVLALAPNADLVRSGFLQRVARVAVPGGVLVAAATMITYWVARSDTATSLEQDRSVAVLAAGGVAFVVLLRVMRPWAAWKLALWAAMAGLFGLAFVVPPAQDFFALELPNDLDGGLALVVVGGAWPVLELSTRLVELVQVRWAARSRGGHA